MLLDPYDLDSFLPFLREQRAQTDSDDRESIARQVLAIVAAFAGDQSAFERATGSDPAKVGQAGVALLLEDEIRRLAETAEGRTLPRGNHDEVVSGVLAGEALFDDYLRIREVEQHQAFDNPSTPAEDAAAVARRAERAEQRRQSLAFLTEMAREDTRICARCGEQQGRHRRNAAREPWEPADATVAGHRFEDVESWPLGRVGDKMLEPAVRSWGTRHRGFLADLADRDVQAAVDFLRAGRPRTVPGTGRTGAGMTLGEALTAAAAGLGWLD